MENGTEFQENLRRCPTLLKMIKFQLQSRRNKQKEIKLLNMIDLETKTKDKRIGVYTLQNYNSSIIFDTGASVSINNNSNDFIKWESDSNHYSLLIGVTAEVKREGAGIVEWIITDDQGQEQQIRTFYYYVPGATVRLFSPQSYFSEGKREDL